MDKDIPVIQATDLSSEDKLKLVQQIMADFNMPNSVDDIANLTQEQCNLIMDKIFNAN